MIHGARHIAALGLAVCALPALAQHIERRGGESPLQGEIVDVTDAGVTIRSDLGAVHFVPWDRVRHVASRTHEQQVRVYKDRAVMLWRARSRIERNDAVLAEPLFERLFETYRGKTHETALVVAEGLLRCRLTLGEQALAVIPALETARLRRAEISTLSYTSLPAIMDDGTSLCAVLPPLWQESTVLDRLYRELRDYNAQGDPVIDAIARLYVESIRRTLDIDAEHALDEASIGAFLKHPGIEILSTILNCDAPAPEIRDRARESFLHEQSRYPEFAQAWMRFFVGRSLLAESGVLRQQRGMMYLLYLPAQYGEAQKFLAGAALHIVAGALEKGGQVEQAARLRAELASRYPYHPAVRTSPTS